MSLTSLLVRDVTILTPGPVTDIYNDVIPNWAAATQRQTTGWLAQSSSFEMRDNRDGTSSTLTLVLPADTVITAHDRVVLDGRTYEVTAEPLRAWTPRGEHHVEVQLGVVDG